MFSISAEKCLRFATLQKLAEKLRQESVNQKVMIYANDFFDAALDGAVDASTMYMEADIQPRPDNDKEVETWNDGFNSGFERGFMEGVAAIEKLFLFCDETE